MIWQFFFHTVWKWLKKSHLYKIEINLNFLKFILSPKIQNQFEFLGIFLSPKNQKFSEIFLICKVQFMRPFLSIFIHRDHCEIWRYFLLRRRKVSNWNMRHDWGLEFHFAFFFLSFTKGTIVKYQEYKKVWPFNNNRNKLCSHFQQHFARFLRNHGSVTITRASFFISFVLFKNPGFSAWKVLKPTVKLG